MNQTRTPRTVLAAIIAVIASTFTVVGAATAPADAMTVRQVRAMAPSTYEQKVQYWINQKRAERGLPKLSLESCTDHYSERWSEHLADTLSFYHQSLDKFFSQCGARWAGETLARGASTPRAMVTAWMKSDGHRRVMLSSSARRLGLAAVLDSRGRWVLTANYTRF